MNRESISTNNNQRDTKINITNIETKQNHIAMKENNSTKIRIPNSTKTIDIILTVKTRVATMLATVTTKIDSIQAT